MAEHSQNTNFKGNKPEDRRSKIKRQLPRLVGYGLLLLLFLPVVHSPLMGDDQPNSLTSGVLGATDWTIPSYLAEHISRWWTSQGRFFPIAMVEGVLVFALFTSPLTYKMFQLVALVASLAATAELLAPYRKSPRNWALALMCLASTVQFRWGYDPSIAFASMIPSAWMKVTIAMLLIRSSRSRRRLRAKATLQALAVFFYTAAILQYELAVLFAPAYFLIPWDHPPTDNKCLDSSGKKARASQWLQQQIAPVTISLIACISFVINVLVLDRPQAAPAYQMVLRPSEVIPTYLKQLAGSLPLWSYIRGHPDSPPSLLIFLVALAAFSLLLKAKEPRLPNHSRNAKRIFFLGILLLFGAPLSTAVSVRWQAEISWTTTYINVFFGYVGSGLILFAAINMAHYRIRQSSMGSKGSKSWVPLQRLILSLIICVLALSLSWNRSALEAINHAGEHSMLVRANLATSIRQGDIFEMSARAIQADQVAIVSPDYNPLFIVNDFFFEMHSNGYHYRVFPDEQSCERSCEDTFLYIEYVEYLDDFLVLVKPN